MKKITQQRIAEELGISRLTVSKALNGLPGIREEMRQLVVQKATEMGYRKLGLQMGTGLVAKKNGSKEFISLFTVEKEKVDTFWAQVISGIISTLMPAGLDLNICPIQINDNENLKVPSNFDPSMTKGVIILGNFTAKIINDIKRLGVPVVSIDTVASSENDDLLTDTVMIFNEEPILRIMKHLVHRGHKKIGYIGNIANCRSYWERWNGYNLGLREHNLGKNYACCILDESLNEIGKEAIRKGIHEMGDLPTAFICPDDHTAIHVIQTLEEMGLNVPKDIAISGFENTFESSLLNLTTVESHKAEIGERAASSLLFRIEHPAHPTVVVRFKTDVVFRDSTEHKRLPQ